MSHIHVIGAGLSGLSAALSLTAQGRAVTVHEAGPAAGGRCRSYFDKELGLRIDNGNHLLLSGNRAASGFVAEVGGWDGFRVAEQAMFPFLDLRNGERWVVHPNKGRIPWWMFVAERRVPETRLSDYLRMARIANVRDDTVVADSMRRGQLYWRLLEPLAIAALNTRPQEGLARLLASVIPETLLRGGSACRPMLPVEGLSEALVDPAVATLRARGAVIRLNSRVAGMTVEAGRVTALRGPDGAIALGAEDAVVLAVPPWVASDLLPGLVAPDAFEAIVNVHYRHDADPQGPFADVGFIGLVGGVAEWVFVKPGHVSVTISAANAMVDNTAARIAEAVWPNVADALGLADEARRLMPAWRVVKEKRATFAATARQEERRPGSETALAANVALAGDWTDTGLPATIEGAIRSGRAAADFILTL
jgi:squalene-associated FAD-dependent desaturase